MPESAEDIHARAVAAADEQGRLPTPPVHEWDSFPWEVVEGELRPKVLAAPVAAEEPRWGESRDKPCGPCGDHGGDRVIWENHRWRVTHPEAPSGLPLTLFLVSKEHLDFPDMDDDLAAEYGRLSVWLCRIMSRLPHVGRVHVNRWGDGGSHLHVWFMARPARLPHVLGSYAVEWDEILPPGPEEVWRADLATVARKLATHDGRARIAEPR
jgi:hypothetical protein